MNDALAKVFTHDNDRGVCNLCCQTWPCEVLWDRLGEWLKTGAHT